MGLLEKLLIAAQLDGQISTFKKVCVSSPFCLLDACGWAVRGGVMAGGGRTRGQQHRLHNSAGKVGERAWLPSYRLIIPCTEMHSQNSFRQTKSHALVHLFLALVDAGKTNAKIES